MIALAVVAASAFTRPATFAAAAVSFAALVAVASFLRVETDETSIGFEAAVALAAIPLLHDPAVALVAVFVGAALHNLYVDVAARLPDGWDICIVTNEHKVVLGLLARSALRSNQQTTVEDAMTAGPSTIRPSARLDAIAKRLHDQNLTRIIVTRSATCSDASRMRLCGG